MKLNKSALVGCLSLIFFIGGCQPPIYHQTIKNTADTKGRIEEQQRAFADKFKSPKSILINQGLYVDQTPISLNRQPSWLRNHIVIRGDSLPFTYYSRLITDGAKKNVLTRLQPDIDDKLSITINYSGTVKGALDLLASKNRLRIHYQ